MLTRLFLIFILVPLADLILLLMIAQIHWLISVSLIVFSGILGAFLVRRQGIAVATSLRTDVLGGKIPTESILDGGMVLLAAGLLLTPGLLTDLFGISFLIPVCRRWYRERIKAWIKTRVQVHTHTVDGSAVDSTLDGEFKKSARESEIVEDLKLDSQSNVDG